MKLYRIMEHAPIKKYTFPFYVEVLQYGIFRNKWTSMPYSSFLNREEAVLYIERMHAEDKLRQERYRATPREIVRGYVATDGVFHPVADK